jgi:hypothetical protein
MSRYLARLKALIAEDTDTRLTDATDKSPCVSFVSEQGSALCDDECAIEERAALAADSVPACYLDAWARFQCRRPFSVDPDAWWRAIEDGGLFLDVWGADARKMRWSTGELFDVPSDGRRVGLVWQLKGKRVCALGKDRARLIDGRTFQRQRGDCD